MKNKILTNEFWRKNTALKDIVIIVLLSLLIFLLSVNTNLFESLSLRLKEYEKWQLDEFIVVLVFLSFSLLVFSVRRWKELKREIITRKNIEKKMISGRAQLQAVLDGVPDMILQVDANMRIRWANRAALEINPNAIGYKAHQAFSYDEGSFLDSYCNWAMELGKIKKGINYQPFIADTDEVSYWEGIGVRLTDKKGNVYGAIAIARDITGRMRVEHTWNLLSSIVESTDDAIFGVSWDGIILSWNKGAEKTYGYAANEIVGKPITVLVPVERQKKLLEIIEWVSRKELIERLEVECIRNDGKRIFISQTICPFVDATGKKIGVSLIDRDITESKIANEALKESEARFKGLFEHMSSGVFVFEAVDKGENFILKDVNRSVEKIEKITQDKLINRKIKTLFLDMNVHGLFEVIRKVWKTGEPEHCLITIKKDDRIISWRENYIYKLSSGEVVAIYDDVTERRLAEQALRESEEKFRSLVTTAPDGIVLTDVYGSIIELNEAFADILGFTRDQMLGAKIFEFLPYKNPPDETKDLLQILQEKNSEYPNEVYAKTKTGKEVPVELAIEALKDEQNKIVSLIAVVHDITERKKFEDELKKSREQLQNRAIHLESAIEAERKRIAFEIHDELGYALTALKLDVSWLAQKMDPSRKQLIKRFDAMEELIETTIKKVRTISTKLRPSILDHFGVVAAIEWQADEFQRRTGIRCVLSVSQKDIKLDDDHSTAIFRIFQETLTNVARHAKATRVDVVLNIGDEELELKVSDNGIGISKGQMSSQKTYGLLGIRERTKFMGGKVLIDSSENKGTSIILNVPLTKKGVSND